MEHITDRQIAKAYYTINNRDEIEIDESTERHPSHGVLEGYNTVLGGGKVVGDTVINEEKESIIESNDIEHDERSMAYMVNELLKLGDKIEDAKIFLEGINNKTLDDITENEKIAVIKLYTAFESTAFNSLTKNEIKTIGEDVGVENVEQFVEFITTRFKDEFDESYVKIWANRIVEGTVSEYADSKTLEILETVSKGND